MSTILAGPLGSATRFRATLLPKAQRLHHDPEHRSVVEEAADLFGARAGGAENHVLTGVDALGCAAGENARSQEGARNGFVFFVGHGRTVRPGNSRDEGPVELRTKRLVV